MTLFISKRDLQTSSIDFRPEEENFDNLMGLYDLLEDIFQGSQVDVVTMNGMSPYIGPEILNEVEYVDKEKIRKIIEKEGNVK